MGSRLDQSVLVATVALVVVGLDAASLLVFMVVLVPVIAIAVPIAGWRLTNRVLPFALGSVIGTATFLALYFAPWVLGEVGLLDI